MDPKNWGGFEPQSLWILPTAGQLSLTQPTHIKSNSVQCKKKSNGWIQKQNSLMQSLKKIAQDIWKTQ